MRFSFVSDSYEPTNLRGDWSKVTDVEGNVWDCEIHDKNIDGYFKSKFTTAGATGSVELVGTGAMRGVTSSKELFMGCTALTKVGIIDFCDSEYTISMFKNCTSLVSVEPLYIDTKCNLKEMFCGCTALREIKLEYAPLVWTLEKFAYGCTSLVSASLKFTDKCKYLNWLFNGCSSLVTAELGDTKNVKDFAGAFYDCANLESVAPIDASSAEVTNDMFRNCKKLSSVQISNTGSVTDMSYMFYYCENLTAVSQLDTQNVVNMSYMFAHCTKLVRVPDMNTPKLTTLDQMFRNCESLVSLPAMNTSKVKSFSHFAHRCYSLESFPAYDTSSATALNRLASCCPKLTTFPLLNTSKATDVDGMLTGHSSSYDTEYPMHIAELPAFDFSNVTNAENAFGNNVALTHIPAYDMPKVTDVSNMYLDCPNVESGMYAAYAKYRDMATPPSGIDKFVTNCGTNTENGRLEAQVIPASWGGAAIDLPAYTLRFKFGQSDFDPTGVTSKGTWTKVTTETDNVWDWTYNNSSWYDVFYNKFNDTNNPVDVLGSGDLRGVTSMEYMFMQCSALHSITMLNGATNMASFCHAGIGGGGPVSIIIAGLEQTTNLYQAFRSCSNMTQFALIGEIGAGRNDVNMYEMCNQCTAITYVHVFDTSHASNLKGLFHMATKLETVPYLDVSSATAVDEMFMQTYVVKGGSYALYQRMAAMANPPAQHAYCFQNCGTYTATGQEELAQIPDDWK